MTCTTCNKPYASPYRQIIDGKIINGCVDKCHDAHLVRPSNSAQWVASAIKSFRAAGVKRFNSPRAGR